MKYETILSVLVVLTIILTLFALWFSHPILPKLAGTFGIFSVAWFLFAPMHSEDENGNTI